MKETIIYLRTSSEEQHPENQSKDCEELAGRLGLYDYEIKPEKKSAFKDNIEREVFNSIKTAIQEGKIKNLIVWDLDRLYRNRKKLIALFELCKMNKVKIYSFRQNFLEDINKAPEPWNEYLFGNMLFIMGWLAEEESNKKSERVKAAVRKKEGITISYKGRVWGRRSVVNERIIEEVLKLSSEGKKVREISKQVYYYDENRNKKPISKSLVHKIITKNGTQNNS